MPPDASLLAVAGLLLLLLASLLIMAGMLLTRQALAVVTDTVKYLVKGWRDNGHGAPTPFQQIDANAQRLDVLEEKMERLAAARRTGPSDPP